MSNDYKMLGEVRKTEKAIKKMQLTQLYQKPGYITLPLYND